MNKKILFTILLSKLAIFVVIYLASSLLPFAQGTYYMNFVYQRQQKVSITTSYQTWDAQHYLFLADKGYKKGNFSNSFYPLFPAVIALGTLITRNFFLSGILMANIFSIVGYCYFYLFVKKWYNEKVAYTALLLFLAFPTSFYFSLIYSESLFFLLSICFFYYLYQNKFFLASVFAFLLPLTRPLGVAIIIPFFLYYLFIYLQISLRNINFKKPLDKRSLFLFSPCIGLGVYFLFMYIKTGSMVEGLMTQQYSVAQWNFFNIFAPQKLFTHLFLVHWEVHSFLNSGIDRIFFISFLCSLFLVYKKTNKVLFSFACILGMVPLLGSFMSYTRYILVAFPIYIAYAKLIEGKYAYLLFGVVYCMLALQTLFLVMHALNFWVA